MLSITAVASIKCNQNSLCTECPKPLRRHKAAHGVETAIETGCLSWSAEQWLMLKLETRHEQPAGHLHQCSSGQHGRHTKNVTACSSGGSCAACNHLAPSALQQLWDDCRISRIHFLRAWHSDVQRGRGCRRERGLGAPHHAERRLLRLGDLRPRVYCSRPCPRS